MYSDKYNSTQMFLNSKYGLQRVYNLLNVTNADGVSLEDFVNQNNLAISDLPFSDLLKTNFSGVDTDKDQIISSEEITSLLNSIDKQGLTYNQLQALINQAGTSADGSKKLLDEVVQNFKKIDKNNDGRVSQEEINAYKLNKEIDDKKDELYAFKASDISIFYNGETSNTDESSKTDTETTSNKSY